MASSDSEPDITNVLVDENGADSSSDSEDELMTSLAALNRSNNLASSAALIKGRKDLKQRDKQLLTGGGSFQSMALPSSILKALLQRGFTTPTPIQRLALPSILSLAIASGNNQVARDHLCMARTGSGKTLCYLLPLLARLMSHSPTFGARALVLVPTRELALQVLKVGKDLSRGIKDEGDPLKWALIVGGESLEDQFSSIADNPDVIIATPGRLLHLIVEMNLDLRAVQYCVFDEADRLFELGFEEQLHEILHKLPPTRQTLLFSATLPSSIVAFAKAGLQNPKLIRLDAESKISKDLQMAYLSVKETEKEALLLALLSQIINAPALTVSQKNEIEKKRNQAQEERENPKSNKKRKYDSKKDDSDIISTINTENQTVVFVATKHHVEYVSALLDTAGYVLSAIYGSMDQTARKIQLSRFRKGFTSILVVTDLAARGLDVPGVRNVINYDFPNGARAFIHRVGRTARAGRTGWAYTFVAAGAELAYLLDLELFLARPLTSDATVDDFNANLVFGLAPRLVLDTELETLKAYFEQNKMLKTLRDVSVRGKKLYERGRQKASPESYRRAKKMAKTEVTLIHPIFGNATGRSEGTSLEKEQQRSDLLAKIGSFVPTETVFEISGRVRGKSSTTPVSLLMKERRKAMEKAKKAAQASDAMDDDDNIADDDDDDEENYALDAGTSTVVNMEDANEEELEEVFGKSVKRKKTYQDSRFYLQYEQEGANTEKGYSLQDGESFVAQANRAVYDVSKTSGDSENNEVHAQRASLLKWDRKSKKFVRSDQVGADNKKIIRSESGQKLPSSFKSGKYDEWQKKTRVKVPRTGDVELKTFSHNRNSGQKRFKHKGGVASNDDNTTVRNRKGNMVKHKTVGKAGRPGSMPGQLKSAAVIRKERNEKAKRVKRSTQPRGKR